MWLIEILPFRYKLINLLTSLTLDLSQRFYAFPEVHKTRAPGCPSQLAPHTRSTIIAISFLIYKIVHIHGAQNAI